MFARPTRDRAVLPGPHAMGFFFLVLVADCVEQLAGAEGLHALRSCSGGCVRTGRNPFASGLLTELCFTFGFID